MDRQRASPTGFLRRRDAQALLDALLVDARRGQLRQERTGLLFADVAEDWFERGRFERDWSASTRADYRSVLDAHLLSEFAPQRIETITAAQIERWRSSLADDELRTRRTVNKIVTQLHSVMEHAVDHHGLIFNPAAKIKRLRESYDAARFDFYSPEEIDRLVAAATAGVRRQPGRPAVSNTERGLRATEDRQDAAIYLTAALTGLRRGELLALRWEDIDFEQSSIRVFEGYSANQAGKPKSRKSRTVPIVDKVARALSDVKDRSTHTAKSDLLFVSRDGTHVDGSALRQHHRPATTALPRPTPHLRFASDQRRQHRPGPGMDGTRRHPDDHALPTPQEPRRRRPTALYSLQPQETQAADPQA